jgi:hypothetical protein
LTLKIGDRVKMIGDVGFGLEYDNCRPQAGDKGTVVDIGENSWVGVEWDNFNKGHSCSGHCKTPRGYYVYSHHLSPIGLTEQPSPIKVKVVGI